MTTLFRRQERKARICDDEPNTAPYDWRSVIAWWLPVLVPFVGVIALAAAAIYWPR